MNYPDYRPRRMRRTEGLRRMVRETRLSADDFVYPLFVVPGSGIEKLTNTSSDGPLLMAAADGVGAPMAS